MATEKYYEVKRKLENYIEEFGLKTGDRLPSEITLAKQFQISRSTLRECLKILQKEGRITTTIGSGSYLCESGFQMRNSISELKGTGQMIEDAGYYASSSVLDVLVTEPEEIWRNMLTLSPEDRVVVVKRIREANHQAVMAAWNIFPECYVNPDEVGKGFQESIFSYLQSEKGIRIQSAQTVIRALSCDDIYDNVARELLGNEILCMEQLHYDQKAHPVFFSLDYVRTDVITIELRRERKESTES